MDLQGLNIFDLGLGGIVLISAIIGIARGLLREMLSLVAWVAALWAAFTFAEMVSQQFVQQVISDKHIAYIASFGSVFLLALFLIGLLNLLITSLFKATGLGGFDRLLGMLFGLARGAIIGAVLIFFARLYPGIEKLPSWQQSQLVPGFSNLANWGIKRIPEHVRAYADSWMNPNEVVILPAQTPNTERQNDPATIELSSLNAVENSQAARPQLSAEQARQQSAQSNALSNIASPEAENAGLRLESLQDQNYEGEIEAVPEETESGIAPLQLESLQP